MERFAHAFLLLMRNRTKQPYGLWAPVPSQSLPLVPTYFPPLPLVPPSSFVLLDGKYRKMVPK